MEKQNESAILEELQCPVCDCYMSPPIFICSKGHSICGECFKKVRICPKCRCSKHNTARNYSLEAIYAKLNIPCKYTESGCDVVLPGECIKKHQNVCKYIEIFCPFRYYADCQWRKHRGNLKCHLQERHPLSFYTREKQKFLSPNFIALKCYHYIYAVIYAHQEFFRLTWDINGVTGMTRWALYFIGPPDTAKLYSYKLEFYKTKKDAHAISLTFKTICEPKPENDTMKFVEHHCFYIHKTLLNDYCNDKGELNYKVTIYRPNNDHVTEIGSLLDDVNFNDNRSDQSE
nr:E3 ubiquitin-protein ligase Siah1-like [Leptinotarsa decemlineata]XP_023015295.1 E3 ubiquitin-protein ligase Siah1-like [Leptinotarsa decemlineata]